MQKLDGKVELHKLSFAVFTFAHGKVGRLMVSPSGPSNEP